MLFKLVKNSISTYLLIWLTSLASTGLAFEATAQTEETAPPVEESAEESVLSLASVNESFQEIEGLRAQLDSDTEVTALQERVEQVEAETRAAVEDPLLATPIESMDSRQLEELLVAVARKSEEMGALRGELTEAIAQADAVRETLRAYTTQWNTALEAPDFEGLPEESADRVRQVAEVAEAAYQQAQGRLGALVELEARTLELTKRLEELSSQAEEQDRVLQTRMFSVTEPPIWQAVARLDMDEIKDDLSSAMQTVRLAVVDLATSYKGRLAFHAFIALVIFVFVLVMRRSPLLVSQPELEPARRALAHPVAVAALLSLVLTEFLYTTAQPAVLTLNDMLFLVAELIVLGAVLSWLTVRRAWLLGTLLIVALSLQLLNQERPLYRVILLFVSIGGIVALAGMWRVLRSETGAQLRGWRRFAGTLVIVFAVLLAAALLGNIVGAVGFAGFATAAVTTSILAAIGLAVLALILDILATLVLESAPAQRLHSVRHNRQKIAVTLRRVFTWAAAFLWVWASLAAFRLLDTVLAIIGWMGDATFQAGELTVSPSGILFFLLTIWLAVYASRLTRFFLDEDVLPRLSLPRGVPGTISTTTHYVILGTALLLGSAAVGFDVSSLAFVAGALGVGIGFGLQNIVSNFMSGLILLFERPIQVGDNVQVGQLMGVVKRIGVRASIVRTYEGSEVIVPNGDLIAQQVTNYTLSDRNRRLEVLVGVAYDTDLDHAKATIEKAVNTVDRIVADPAPMVLFQGFGDSSLDFRVLFWVPDFDISLSTASAVGMAIRRALQSEGIEIPFPQRDVHLRSAPGDKRVLPTMAEAPKTEAPRTQEVEDPDGDS